MTLLTKVQNETINENLKKRFENQEIYVSLEGTDPRVAPFSLKLSRLCRLFNSGQLTALHMQKEPNQDTGHKHGL